MSSANWFAKKLGTAPQPSPAAPPQSYREPPPQNPSPQPGPDQYPQQPSQDRAPQGATPDQAYAAFQRWMATGTTAGGAAHKTGKVGECPGCGSGNYLELKNGPSCFDCGYPIIQFGSELGEGNQQ